MTRRQKDPLRVLTEEERHLLVRISRSHAEPVSHVARAKALLAVADGMSYTAAAKAAGRRSGDAVSKLVSRFNQEGLAAIEPGHGGGPTPLYTAKEHERILAEVRRRPNREKDATATWSLSTLQRALRRAPDGLPRVSTYTIWKVLKEAGFDWQRTRSWCEAGKVKRKRKVVRWLRSSTLMPRLKNLIEGAYREGEKLDISVWGVDQAGPFQLLSMVDASPPMAGSLGWQRRMPNSGCVRL